MRHLLSLSSLAVLALSTSCINLDLANGQANSFVATIDASGAGFGEANISFDQVVSLDPIFDEQRVGTLAVDTLDGQPISVEFFYLREDMIRLEDLLSVNNPDPRGANHDLARTNGDVAGVRTFRAGDPRLQGFLVGMFVTFPHLEEILDEGGDPVEVTTLETKAAFCNFIDPNENSEINSNLGCIQFQENQTEGVNNILGSVSGLGGENTMSVKFQDLIVIDEAKFQEIVLELGNDFNLASEETREALAESILVRIAQNEPGTAFLFNANLSQDLK